jgi:AAA+ ATPase superfamily predicted ATPase
MINPFIFGKVVTGGHFLNRESEVSQISQTLLAGQNVICYSPRRYGKTSMMMRVKDVLSAKGQVVFFIDLFRVTSLEDLYNIYATSIVSALQGPFKTLLTAVQAMLPTVNPKIVFKSPESPTVEISVPLPVLSKSATLRELFDSLEMYCRKKHKKGTVIFDEFQEITAIADGAVIEREMRSAFQHHENVSYAFLGSKNHLLKSIFRNKNRPFYNFGRHFELDEISSRHWTDFIAKAMDAMCSTEVIERIIAITGNHPYYTQMYCHYLWEYGTQHKRPLDFKALDTVLQDVLQRDSMLFTELWDAISIKERHLCKAIASEEPRSLYDKRFLLVYNLGTASSIQKAADKLFNADYIRKKPSGHIDFINPFFKIWVKQVSSSSFSIPDS